jgi:FlaA1/EpsC-like NDP-sugar epimerase
VAALPVARLLLLDRDENSMFELLRSFNESQSSALVEVISTLGDIRDEGFVRHAFSRWRPEVVIHAAAYKHVPMMEENPCEAVLNNVSGTRIVRDAALKCACDRLLLISTDKAVEPVSVMGATKRTAELLMQQSDASPRRAVRASVRFVNVTGSRGSVVPIFEEQIARGGPVTVTHEQMTRYFMRVEDAARLLLEVATLDGAGKIYALETGQPVSVMDLARGMIAEAGMVPDLDVKIKVTGARAGERLAERLHGVDESLAPTAFAGIDEVWSSAKPILDCGLLAQLETSARNRDARQVIELLGLLPIGYVPLGVETRAGDAVVANS